MLDLLIVGGQVLDGTGSPSVRADVGVSGGRIAAIGDLAAQTARRTIQAEGQVVCPGFIDLHAHDDFNLPVNPLQPGKVLQGVTTDVVGNCGFSPAPVVPEHLSLLKQVAGFVDSGLDWRWRTFAEFLAALPPTGLNIVPLVGHVTVRCGAMGVEDRPPSPAELQHMQEMVDEAMRAGAFGFSTGLIYPPCCYAKTDEIVALAKVAARHGGSYHTHMRDEGVGVLDSIREAVEIGERAGTPVQISHLKVVSKANWGRSQEVLALLDEVRAKGAAVYADQYPYTAASTGLKVLLPQWAHVGGSEATVARLRDPAQRERIRSEVLAGMGAGTIRIGSWEDALVSDSTSHPDYAGLNLAQVAQREDRQPVEALLDLLIADRASTLAIFMAMDEGDLRAIMRHPAVGIGSDGIYLGSPDKPDRSKFHPRYFGTFPRVVGRYAREEHVLELPDAIRKMTGLSAAILGFRDRGLVKTGYAADLVVFDPATILDRATFTEPNQVPAGVSAVIVNGVLAAQDGRMTGAAAGKILRRTR